MDETQKKQAMLNDLMDQLYSFIQNSDEFKRLFQCTQTRDEFVGSGDPNRTNRGIHSLDVSKNAGTLARNLVTNGENRALTPEEYSQVRLAEVIGLSHDLGHTPKGHAAELMLKKDCGTGFNHAQYSGVVFEKIYRRFLAERTPEEVALLNEYKILDTVVKGVQGHSRWYSSEADKITVGEERTTPEKMAEIPLLAVRIADGVSFAPADLYDLSNSDRADGGTGRVISPEMMIGVLEGTTTVVSDPNYPTKPMLTGVTPAKEVFEETGYDYRHTVDMLTSGPTRKEAAVDIQIEMIKELSAEALRGKKAGEKTTIVDRSDELKTLRAMAKSDTPPDPDNWFDTFIEKYEGNKYVTLTPDQKTELRKKFLNDKGQLKSFQEALNDLQNEFRRRCPMCSVALEVHDELVYHQMFDRGEEGTVVLGNEEQKTREAITKMFGEYCSEWEHFSDDQKKAFLESIGIYRSRMPGANELDADGKPKLSDAKIYAIIQIQQKTNSDIDDYIKKMEADRAKAAPDGADPSKAVPADPTPDGKSDPADPKGKTAEEDKTDVDGPEEGEPETAEESLESQTKPTGPDDTEAPVKFDDGAVEQEPVTEGPAQEVENIFSENIDQPEFIEKNDAKTGRDTAAETLEITGVDMEINTTNMNSLMQTMQQDLEQNVNKSIPISKTQEEEVSLE